MTRNLCRSRAWFGDFQRKDRFPTRSTDMSSLHSAMCVREITVSLIDRQLPQTNEGTVASGLWPRTIHGVTHWRFCY